MLLGGTVGVALEEAVMRVGYKDEMVFLFLPDEDGVYKVWRTGSSTWSDSELAADARTYALIDPPEAAGAVYDDSASCHVIKYASNNAAKHYKNWEKDGMLLMMAMPSQAEALAMIPILWTERTPLPLHDTAKADEKMVEITSSQNIAEGKVAEIEKRIALVGCILRVIYDNELFWSHVQKIVLEAKTDCMTMDIDIVSNYYFGTMTNSDSEASSMSSKMYILESVAGDASRKKMLARFNPLAKLVTRKRLAAKIRSFDFKTAFQFENYTRELLNAGGSFGGGPFPPRVPVHARDNEDTAAKICALTDGNKFVVASTNFPLLDFAVSCYELFNAKIGDQKIAIKSSAFLEVLQLFELVSVDEFGKLQWEKGKGGKGKIRLTFMRNTDNTSWHFQDTTTSLKKQTDAKFGAIKEFFNENVEVNCIDVSALEHDTAANVAAYLNEYEVRTNDKIDVTEGF